jgi:hypothetical protein
MIPFYLLPKLTSLELLIYQIVQTIFHFLLFVILLFGGLMLLLKDKSEIEPKNIVSTGLIVEIATAVVSFFSSFLLIGGAVSAVTNVLIANILDFLILYLRYYEKDRISEVRVFLLFIISFPIAYFVSITLTNLIFALFGIKDTYVLINT